jgi:hypothetical protein
MLACCGLCQQQSAVVADNEDNFKAFIYGPPSRLPILEGRKVTVIKWWAQPTQRQTFPALSQLAIDVLMKDCDANIMLLYLVATNVGGNRAEEGR